jgi:hypothetical protein
MLCDAYLSMNRYQAFRHQPTLFAIRRVLIEPGTDAGIRTPRPEPVKGIPIQVAPRITSLLKPILRSARMPAKRATDSRRTVFFL